MVIVVGSVVMGCYHRGQVMPEREVGRRDTALKRIAHQDNLTVVSATAGVAPGAGTRPWRGREPTKLHREFSGSLRRRTHRAEGKDAHPERQ